MGGNGRLLVVIGLGGLVAGVALLHHRIKLSAFSEHLAEIVAAPGGNAGGDQDGKGHQQKHRQPHFPVFPQHHHRNDDDLHKAHDEHIHDIMDAAAHIGNILLDAVDDLPGRGLIDKADGQPADLIGNTDAEIAGVVAAHHIVPQVHFPGFQRAFYQVDRRQSPAKG